MASQAQLYSDYQDNNISFSNSVVFPSGFGDDEHIMNFGSGFQVSSFGFQDLSSELQKQRLEMDYFLDFQNELLKAVLNEESINREMMLLQSYESKMKSIIDAKDEILNAAKMRRNELQNHLLMAEKEADDWKRKSMETEVMMTELHTKVVRATRHEDDAESIVVGKETMVCKVCHVRSTCMLLLPCRHLCCCSLLMLCPLCESVKNESLEVFLGLN